MNRRQFMKTGAVSTIGATTLTGTASADDEDTETIDEQDNFTEGEELGFIKCLNNNVILGEEATLGLIENEVIDTYENQDLELFQSNFRILRTDFDNSTGESTAAIEPPEDMDEIDNHLSAMDGTGTEEDPYLIYTEVGLQALDSDRNGHFRLENSIDCSSYENWNNWTDEKVGYNPVVNFSGTLDGNGYSINNFYSNRINQDDSTLGDDNVGFIATMDDATIKDLSFKFDLIRGDENTAVFNIVENSTIENVYIEGGNITSNTTASTFYEVTNSTIKARANIGTLDTNDDKYIIAKDITDSYVTFIEEVSTQTDYELYNTETNSDFDLYTSQEYENEETQLIDDLSGLQDSNILDIIDDEEDDRANVRWKIQGYLKVYDTNVIEQYYLFGEESTTKIEITKLLDNNDFISGITGRRGEYRMKVQLYLYGNEISQILDSRNGEEYDKLLGGDDGSDDGTSTLTIVGGTVIAVLAAIAALSATDGKNNNKY